LAVVLITIFAAALIVAIIQIVRVVRERQGGGRKGSSSFQQFHREILEAGFTSSEAVALYEFARASNLEDPANILFSYKALDIVIKTIMQKFSAEGKEKNSDSQEFLGKLLDLRKQITVQKLNARKKLSHSKEITAGQEVQVILSGVGVFTTKVMPHDVYFSVLSPIVFDLPPNFKWENRKVMIFFRRRNDGEYSFNTTVVEEIEDEKTGEYALLLNHQEALSHTQKRHSVRVLLNRAAHLYPIGDGLGGDFAEGKMCTVYDISDDGCAVMVEGKMDIPSAVIIQFSLSNQSIGINGECRNAQYSKASNMTTLHICSNSIPRDVKNIILSVTFGLASKGDDLPLAAAPLSMADDREGFVNQLAPRFDAEKPADILPPRPTGHLPVSSEPMKTNEANLPEESFDEGFDEDEQPASGSGSRNFLKFPSG
jgi:hypothetical protein